MSTDGQHPLGLLSDAERETLTATDTDSDEYALVCERVRERLTAALRDCQVLYPTLRDSDFEAVFAPGDETEVTLRAAIQDALGVLVLGMLWNDDRIETRLADAIRYAGFAYGEEIDATVDIRRSPMPTPEQWLARPETTSFETGLVLFEHLLWDQDVPPERVAAVGRQLGLDDPLEAVQDTRETEMWCQRAPQTAVCSVETTSAPLDAQSSDDQPSTDQ